MIMYISDKDFIIIIILTEHTQSVLNYVKFDYTKKALNE